MPQPEPPPGWEVHLSSSKLRYYFYDPSDGSAVWPGNLQAHLSRKEAGEKPASAEAHKAYLESLDTGLAKTIRGKCDYFFSELNPALREQIMMDEEASYSVTEQRLAEASSVLIKDEIAKSERTTSAAIAQWTITDATACVGGNTISFSKHFSRVHAVEIDTRRCEFLRHNVGTLCSRDNVVCHCADYTNELANTLQQDIVFFDPPWGGLSYKDEKVVPLFLSDVNISDICRGLQGKTKYIVLKVPINFDFTNFTGDTSRVLENLLQKEMYADRNRRPKFTLMVLKFRPNQKNKRPASEDIHDHNAKRYNRNTDQHKGESEEHRRKGPAIQLKNYHNTVKRALINRFASGAAEVLDIASGQGGDLRKWVDAGVLRITGLDRAESEVAEATRRFKDMVAKGENWSHQRQTIGGQSASQPLVAEYHVIDTVGKKELSLRDGFFDAITIMFAFHYFFENFDTLGQVLSDVGRCLKPGGYFFGTMPDGQRVLDLLGDKSEFRNSFLKIGKRWEGKKKAIGSLYAFGIADTVTKDIDDAENLEFLAMLDTFLVPMARKHGLRCVTELEAPALEQLLDPDDVARSRPFKHFAPERPNPRDRAGKPHIENEDLRKASWVNCCFVFQKQ